MKLKPTLTAIAVSLAFITGCEAETGTQASQAPALPQAAKAENPVLVTINDAEITKDMFSFYLRERMRNQPQAQATPQVQAQALDELIKIVLLAQDATKQKMDEAREVQMAMEVQRMQLLSSIALSQYANANKPSEETLKKAYEEKHGGSGAGEEYHARHILVKTEDEAKDLISKINNGGDFAELAKEHSTGPTGKSGGDLGWFGAGQMVKPFSDAVAAMKKGSTSQTPVQTQFGWHVIKLEDKRTQQPPSFEEVEKTLMTQEQRKILSAYVKGLSDKANIQLSEGLSKPNQ